MNVKCKIFFNTTVLTLILAPFETARRREEEESWRRKDGRGRKEERLEGSKRGLEKGPEAGLGGE